MNTLDEKTIKEALKDYNLLSKYDISTIVTIINNYCNEEEKINYLRNEDFVNKIPSNQLELLLNNMHFENVFNMLQNKHILNKINNLDVYIENTYEGLITSYLNSQSLVKKTSSLMIYKLLINLNEDEVNKYLKKKYILNKLTSSNLLDISINKNIILNNIESLSKKELYRYIDNLLYKTKNIDIINNYDILKRLFDLNNNTIKRINLDEVKYLYESINTKSVITIQDNSYSIKTYKGILSLYLIYGFNNAKKIANKEFILTVSDANNIINKITELKLYQYKLDNNYMFDNMPNNFINELSKYNDTYDIRNNPYIKNIISLSNIYNYGNLMDYIRSYYYENDNNKTKIKMFNIINGLEHHIYKIQKKLYLKETEKVIKNTFSLKSNVLYNQKKELSNNYLKKLKIRFLIQVLNTKNINYQSYFKNGLVISDLESKLVNKFKEYNISLNEIISTILIPYINNNINNNDEILNKVIHFINYYIDTFKVKMEYRYDYEKYINSISIDIPFNHYNYDIQKKILGINDYEKIFRGYDLNKIIKNKSKLYSFINNNKLFLSIANNYLDDLVFNLGFIINYFDELNDVSLVNVNQLIYKKLNLPSPIDNISIKLINNILLDHNIIDFNELQKRYINNLKTNYYSIPYINGITDSYHYELIDKHNIDLLQYNDDNYYIKVNDLKTNKEEAILALERIKETIIIKKINGIVNNDVIKNISKDILNKANDIHIVITDIKEFVGFIINPNLLNISNSNEFKIVNANKNIDEDLNNNTEVNNYLRKRNIYKVIGCIPNENDIKKIKAIISVYNLNKTIFTIKYKEIYYGDDWIITISFNNDIRVYNDNEFNHNEIQLLLNKIKKVELSSTFLIPF